MSKSIQNRVVMYVTDKNSGKEPKISVRICHGHWTNEFQKHSNEALKIDGIEAELSKIKMGVEKMNQLVDIETNGKKEDRKQQTRNIHMKVQKEEQGFEFDLRPRLKSKLKTRKDMTKDKSTQVKRSTIRLLKRMKRYLFKRKRKVKFDLRNIH